MKEFGRGNLTPPEGLEEAKTLILEGIPEFGCCEGRGLLISRMLYGALETVIKHETELLKTDLTYGFYKCASKLCNTREGRYLIGFLGASIMQYLQEIDLSEVDLWNKIQDKMSKE